MTIHIIGKGGMAKDWMQELYSEYNHFVSNHRIYFGDQFESYEGEEIETIRDRYFVGDALYICVGYPKDRKKIYDELVKLGVQPGFKTEYPEMRFSNAFVGADAEIGKQVLLHTHSSVGHDSAIGDFVSLMPGARVSGKCEIGEGVLIGANAVILPGVKVGAWAQIGAGAVIARDVNPGEVWVAGLSKCVRVEDER